MDPLSASLNVASSGLHAQSTRLRVVSENIANSASTSLQAGGDPYTRKTITFAEEVSRAMPVSKVRVAQIGRDGADFPLELDPGNVAADANGYVKLPNVNVLVEMADMREANRSYEANIQVMRQVRELVSMTIGLLGQN
ncbi:flagellar basal body rod protein FlgC [Zhengella mangrovi]|uniref:Flagellar basal-body rod protein FlgC n=1 Tax=Zhengella mangrovi TaxID=1982044 RepID=A0A2G1QJU2_9HYPH|nr:flagellar basal body rod protein FlgC [Zhengella mangrovi]PHP65739.1 flagellar basal body rod protein FlgC [Zhengella mangrovi]